MYEKRKKSPLGKAFYKLTLNNLAGKMAQRTNIREYKIADIGLGADLEEKGYLPYTSINEFENLYVRDVEKKYGRNYAPIISSYVTATARDILYDEARKIPINDLLYLATDAIIFKGNHLDKYRIDNEMGNMKIVKYNGKEIKNEKCIIYGKNNYVIGEDVRFSGVKKDFLENYVFGQSKIKYERFKNIKNSGSIKESFGIEKLEKDMNELVDSNRRLEKYVKEQEIIYDTDTDLEWVLNKDYV